MVRRFLLASLLTGQLLVADPLSQLSVASWDLAVATALRANLHELIKLLAPDVLVFPSICGVWLLLRHCAF